MMKRYLGWISIVLVVVFAFSGCNKIPKEMSVKDVQEILKNVNANPYGIKFQATDQNITARPAELEDDCDGFVITLKEPDVTFDTTLLQEFYPQLNKTVIPMKTQEVVMAYDYKKERLSLLSLSGVALNMNLLDLVKTDASTKEELPAEGPVMVTFTADKVKLKNYIITSLMNTGEATAKEVMLKFMEDNNNVHSVVTDMDMKMSMDLGLEKKARISVTSERLEAHQRMRSDFFTAWMKGEMTVEKADRMMAGGLPMFHMYGKFLNTNFDVEMMGKEVAVGNLWQLDFSNFLKPDDKGKFYEYGFFYNVKQLRSSIPAADGLEQLLTNFKELNINFIINNLTPDVVAAYLKIASINFSNQYKDEQARQQALMAEGMAFGQKFMASKPIFKFTILPFRNHFGEVNLDSSFQFLGAEWPKGKATVRVKEISKMIANIQQDDFISEKVKKKLISLLSEYFLPDPNDTGVLTFEVESGQPGRFILNGKPLKK
jgi:hypothetical protein